MTYKEIWEHAYALRKLLGVDTMWGFLNDKINKKAITREKAQKIAEEVREKIEGRFYNA